MVLLNTALALHIAAPDLSVDEAFALARATIDSGKALAQLNRLIALTNQGV